MKKAMALLVLAMGLFGSCALAGEGAKTFVTSFYPMYIFAQNIAQCDKRH